MYVIRRDWRVCARTEDEPRFVDRRATARRVQIRRTNSGVTVSVSMCSSTRSSTSRSGSPQPQRWSATKRQRHHGRRQPVVQIVERERDHGVTILFCQRFEVRRDTATGHVEQRGLRAECLACPRAASIGQKPRFTQVLREHVDAQVTTLDRPGELTAAGCEGCARADCAAPEEDGSG